MAGLLIGLAAVTHSVRLPLITVPLAGLLVACGGWRVALAVLLGLRPYLVCTPAGMPILWV